MLSQRTSRLGAHAVDPQGLLLSHFTQCSPLLDAASGQIPVDKILPHFEKKKGFHLFFKGLEATTLMIFVTWFIFC